MAPAAVPVLGEALAVCQAPLPSISVTSPDQLICGVASVNGQTGTCSVSRSEHRKAGGRSAELPSPCSWDSPGSSPAAQLFRLCFHCSGQGRGVQSLVRELRSHVPRDATTTPLPPKKTLSAVRKAVGVC